MSYILDALSKSQKERERATVPTLTTEFSVEESKRRAPKALAGAAVGLLSIGVLFAAFGLSGRAFGPQGSSHGIPATARLSSAPTTTAPLTRTVTERHERVESTALDFAAPSPILASGKKPRPEQPASTPARKTRARDHERSRTRQPDVGEGTLVASAPEPSQEVLADRQLSRATRWLVNEMAALEQIPQGEAIGKHESPAPAREADAVAMAPVATGARKIRSPPMPERVVEKAEQRVLTGIDLPAQPTDEVPALGDLPAETRSAIPALEVNVHTYTRTRKGRMVFINMKRYAEGDRLAEGPMIDTITPTGVVLIHEQQRFHLPAR